MSKRYKQQHQKRVVKIVVTTTAFRCAHCGQDKYKSEMTVNKRAKKGVDSWCKDCRREYMHEYYQTHKEHLLALNQEWVLANPERRRASQHKYDIKMRLSDIKRK